MIPVSLVQLGEDSGLRLDRLAKVLNRRQKCFEFSFGGDIPNIGPPTRFERFYEFDVLFKFLARKSLAAKFVIGVTHEFLTGAQSDGPTGELEYFSLSDFKQYAVVTTAMQKWSSPNRSREQYLAFLLLGELLVMAAGQDLMHSETRRCMFDDCEERSVFRNTIEASAICRSCSGKLVDNNVDRAVIEAAERILKWCKRRPWRSTLSGLFSNPVASLVTGVAGGWFAAIYLTRVEWVWILIPTLFVIAAVLVFERMHT